MKSVNPERQKRPPLVLIILDGWGLAPPGPYNVISQAKTPTINKLWNNYPHTKLYAHGNYVGLPNNQVGNSEAGHLNIGAGRIVLQDSVYISESIHDGTFFKNPAFLEAIQHVKQYNSTLHLIGILSGDECPHMSPEHLAALVKLVSQHKTRALLHFFTDGRDSPPCAARQLWEKLKALFVAKSCVFVASVSGRIYLDRKKTWERTEKIYNALVLGTSDYRVPDIETGIQLAYQRGETDEFIQPTLVRNKDVTAKDNISDNDSIIFYNLRSDRARQFTKPFVQQDFESLNQNSFNRFKILRNLKFVAMTDFGPDLNVLTAFPSRDVPNTLPVALGPFYRQLYMSETEKYAHVTYFFNGGYKNPVAGEGRILVKSKAVDSYDKVPAMSVKEIADVAVETLRNKWYNFICVNFSNADMVGHTGNIEAARKGCEAVDRAVKKIWEVVKGEKGEMIITADHGNAENMYNPESKVVDTMHETNPVPLVIYTKKPIKLKGQDYTDISQAAGKLGDIAPTILDLAGIEKPKEMTGESLIERLKN